MPRYFYRAKTGPKDIEEGIIEAENKLQAVNRLQERGLFPFEVEEQMAKVQESLASRLGFIQKVGLSDLCVFTRQLSSLLDSGLTLLAALNIVYQQTQNRTLQFTIHQIADEVKDGKTFSDALSKHPKIFSTLYSSIIKAGEASGGVNIVLDRLADFSENEEELRSKIKAAMAYPVLITIVGSITVFVLLSFVIPKLVMMFQDLGQTLPLPTRILIGISGFFKGYWWLVVAVVLIFIFAIKRISQTHEGRISLDSFYLKLPFFGELIAKMEISRFSRTLSMLLGNGVAILPSLEIVKQTMTNQVLKNEVEVFQTQIRDGASLAASIKKSSYFPIFVANIIAIGEETGLLEKSLSRVSVAYEREVDRVVKTITTLLEPVLILFMGLIVGFIVVSILLPIFQINMIAR